MASAAVSRWMGLVAGMWVQAAGGSAYMFPHYSPLLKNVLQYNQQQLNNLGAAKDIGENVGLLAGILCNKLPAWFILCIGALESVFGYGVLWLVATERISPLPYWQMCVMLLIGANTATWFNTAVLVICMRNFPQSRGSVVGILKGFVGLSGAVFTQIFASFFNKDAASLLLMLAVTPLGICLVSMWFVRPVPASTSPEDADEETNFFFFINVVALAMAFYLLAATLVQDLLPVSHLASHIITAVMLLFLVAPLVVPGKFFVEAICSPAQVDKSKVEAHGSNDAREPLLKDVEKVAAVEGGRSDQQAGGSVNNEPTGDARLKGDLFPISEIEEIDTLLLVGEGAVLPAKRRKGPRRGEDFKLKQAFVKADFWLLFLTYFCGVGTGITVINNLGQIGESLGYGDVSIFISLVCICNFLGRLGGGALSEYFVRLDAVPRTVWMAVAQIVMILGYVLLATALPGTLYVGSALLGFCYGVHFSTMVPTASELFGLKHFGMIYNFLTMANPVGSIIFSGWIAGTIYDNEARKSAGSDSGTTSLGNLLRSHLPWLGEGDVSSDGSTCLGPRCYRLTFLVLAATCVVGIALNFILTHRIKRVYVALYKSPPRNESLDSLLVSEDGTATSIPRVGSKGSLNAYLPRRGSRDALTTSAEPTSLQRSGSQGSSYRRVGSSDNLAFMSRK